MPSWLIEAERQYQIAQALPNRSAKEAEEMSADELDAIINVAEIYRGVFAEIHTDTHTVDQQEAIMGMNVKFETGGLSDFAKRLRDVVASFPVEQEDALLIGGKIVADVAKAKTNSVKTRSTIRVLPPTHIGDKPVVIVGAGESGGDLLPLLLEGGNGKFTEWSHPVFGNLPDVKQKTHPYLRPALIESEPAIIQASSVAVEEMLDEQVSGTFGG